MSFDGTDVTYEYGTITGLVHESGTTLDGETGTTYTVQCDGIITVYDDGIYVNHDGYEIGVTNVDYLTTTEVLSC
jgi:hypothetical protein